MTEGTPILLTSANFISEEKDPTFRYTFQNTVDLTKKKISINTMSIPFSWFNVTSTFSNNTFQYTWPTRDTTCSIAEVAANVLTLTVASTANFADGDRVFVTNMAVSTFLNGLYLSPITVVDGTHISVPYVHANVGPTVAEGGNVVQITTFTVTIADGGYNVSDLNLYLISVMELNKTYVIDGTGNHVYLLSMILNVPAYAITLNSLVYTSVGYSLPVGSTYAFPSISTNPQFIIPNNGFQRIIGVSAQTFPTLTAPASVQSLNSDLAAPEVSPIPNLLISIDKVNNPYSNNNVSSSGIINSSGTTFGDFINYEPKVPIWNSFIPGGYPYIDFKLYDPIFAKTVVLQDTQVTIVAIIADAK